MFYYTLIGSMNFFGEIKLVNASINNIFKIDKKNAIIVFLFKKYNEIYQ
ncbi:hypothetical protein Barb6_02102 [Bacteroidales bacterium Barb6]|nr:hypothetical protein Barb6_02102 [Bacteroidales bacterium Barb6]